MVIFDWNTEEKKDIQDDFLEYSIFKACTENDAAENTLFDTGYDCLDMLDDE